MRDSRGLEDIPDAAEIEADVTLWCSRCGDTTRIPLDATDTWHDVNCETCRMEYGIVFRLE